MTQKLYNLQSPVVVNYELDCVCNNNCMFCYNSENRHNKLGTKELAFSILDKLAHNDVFQVNLLGGEPTLIPYFGEILEYGVKLGLYLGFATNGTYLSDDICKIILENEISMGVSLHSYNSETHDKLTGNQGSFNSAIATLDKLHRYGIPHSVNYVLTKDNLMDFKKLYIDVVSHYSNVKVFYLNRFIPAGRSQSNLHLRIDASDINKAAFEFVKLYEKYGVEVYFGDSIPLCILYEQNRKYNKACSVGVDFLVLDTYGNVKLCVGTQRTIGNILNQSLAEIWHGEYFEEYRKLMWLPKVCQNCEILFDCICGCHYSSPESNAYAYGPDELIPRVI